MENELHNKSLKELRVLYPGIKSTSKVGFIERIPDYERFLKIKRKSSFNEDSFQEWFNNEPPEVIDKKIYMVNDLDGNTKELVLETRVLKPLKINITPKLDEGLGDTIENVLNSPAIAPITKAVKKLLFKDGETCVCKEKKVWLNQKFKYKLKPRCLTEQEHKEWGKFAKNLTLKIEDKQIKYICKLYSEVMQRQYFEPCRNCSPKPLIYMIDNLNVVYDSYK